MSKLIDKEKLIEELLKLPGVGTNSHAMKLIYRFKSPKVELNDNQKTVLKWMKENYTDGSDPIGMILYLEKQNIKSDVMYSAVRLNSMEQAQVLQVFSEWVLGVEGE